MLACEGFQNAYDLGKALATIYCDCQKQNLRFDPIFNLRVVKTIINGAGRFNRSLKDVASEHQAVAEITSQILLSNVAAEDRHKLKKILSVFGLQNHGAMAHFTKVLPRVYHNQISNLFTFALKEAVNNQFVKYFDKKNG